MKKLIILLMAVSIMLTSCGKSAGLSNRNKKADNKSPANNTSTKNQLQKIDNDNIKQSWTDDHMFAIISISVIVIAVAIGSFFVGRWTINRKNNIPNVKFSNIEVEPLEEDSPEWDNEYLFLRSDYSSMGSLYAYCLTCTDDYLKSFIKVNGCLPVRRVATFVVALRKHHPFVPPPDLPLTFLYLLNVFSFRNNQNLVDIINSGSPENFKIAAKFIYDYRQFLKQQAQSAETS